MVSVIQCAFVCVYVRVCENPSHTDESWEGRNKCMWIYLVWIYSLSSLENTNENRIFSVRSQHHKHFGKAQHQVLWALWWHQLFSTRPWIYTLWIYSLSTLQNTDENRIFFVRSPQAFWQSLAPGALRTLGTLVVLYSLNQATMTSPGKNETRVCE